MHTKWSGTVTLQIFFVITVVGFVLWIGALLAGWFLLRTLGFSTDPWSMVSALSTALAAAAVFGAGFIAYRELSEASNSRHMEVVDRLFAELNSPINIESRRWIYQSLPADPAEGVPAMTPEGRLAMKQVLNSLDHVAFLTQPRWIPEDMIMPWMSPMIVKCWEKLEPYVDFEKTRRNEPNYYQKAAELAQRCRAWRQKNVGDTQVKWVDDAL